MAYIGFVSLDFMFLIKKTKTQGLCLNLHSKLIQSACPQWLGMKTVFS